MKRPLKYQIIEHSGRDENENDFGRLDSLTKYKKFRNSIGDVCSSNSSSSFESTQSTISNTDCTSSELASLITKTSVNLKSPTTEVESVYNVCQFLLPEEL